jgi:lipopolysaccharide export system protein LptA
MFRNRLLIVSMLMLSMLPHAWALRSDRNQPIDIKADRVEVDQREQVSHYLGNVRLEQGSLKINADEVVVYMEKGKLYKIVITGNPARFEQQPENQQEVVNSQAENMEYYAGEERLLLRHNAEVNQGGNHFRGDFIEYDTLTSTVKANKGENSQSRVHAIIQPATEKDETTQPPTADKPKVDAKQPPPATGKP